MWNITLSPQDIINHTSHLRHDRLRALSDLLIILWKNSFSLVKFTELYSGLPGSSEKDKEKKNSLKIHKTQSTPINLLLTNWVVQLEN